MNVFINNLLSIGRKKIVDWDAEPLRCYDMGTIYPDAIASAIPISGNRAAKVSPTLLIALMLSEGYLNQNIDESFIHFKRDLNVVELVRGGYDGEEHCEVAVIEDDNTIRAAMVNEQGVFSPYNLIKAYDEGTGIAPLLLILPSLLSTMNGDLTAKYDEIKKYLEFPDTLRSESLGEIEKFVTTIAEISQHVADKLDFPNVYPSIIKTGKFAPLTKKRVSQLENLAVFPFLSKVVNGNGAKAGEYTPVSVEDFNGKFKYTKKTYEEAEIEKVEGTYRVPKEVSDMCHDIQKSTDLAYPVRTVGIIGPAGSGKTAASRAIAAGCGLPYDTYVCNTETTLLDIAGHFAPRTEGEGSAYVWVESDIIRGLKEGHVVELQEVSNIMNPGTLKGLNNLIEFGSIMLDSGEVVVRHPDSVLIMTANVGYAGDRGIEQSIISRCNRVIQMDTPTKDELVERAMARTRCMDRNLVAELAEKIELIQSYCKDQGITDGSCGFRELLNWITVAMMGVDPYERARDCVVNKATLNEEDREAIIEMAFDGIDIG